MVKGGTIVILSRDSCGAEVTACTDWMRVHTDCLLEWGALFPKAEHPDQTESQKFEGDVPNLDLTVDSTQGQDGFIDDPYIPGDQGYRPLPRREHARQTRTQSPA